MRTLYLPLAAAAMAALGGCVTFGGTHDEAMSAYEAGRTRLQAPVTANQTTYADGLRCMDSLLARHGVKMSVLVEDIPDKAGGKAHAGAQDMLLAAFSQMSQRSGGAIRTVAYGGDTRNLAELQRLSGSKASFNPDQLPEFALRGSVTQYDENLVRATEDGGFSLGPLGVLGLGGGAARSTTVNLIGLDLALVRAGNWSLVPGVGTSNVAAIVQRGKGLDAEVSYHKRLGANYSRSFARSDGRGVAMRHLVDLSAIELAGRFGKVPYWQCTGTPATHPDVAQTVDDWVASMGAPDRLALMLTHFRRVGMFAADGEVDPALFKMAFRAYADALGAERDRVSDAMLRAHFLGDPWSAGEKARAAYQRELARLPSLGLDFGQVTAGGEGFLLRLTKPAHVQCFLHVEGTGGYRRLAASPAPVASGTVPMPVRDAGRRSTLLTPGLAHALVCLASDDDRSREVDLLWERLERRGVPPGLDALRALRQRLAAQGNYVAMAALAVRVPRGRR